MQHNDSNFEVNLLPVISLLAVLIAFLLVNAIWVDLGVLSIKQAIGEKAEVAKETATLDVVITSSGDLSLSVKNEKSWVKSIRVKSRKGKYSNLPKLLKKVRDSHPELKTATVVPNETSKYQSLIKVFEELKSHDIKNIGVSPI